MDGEIERQDTGVCLCFTCGMCIFHSRMFCVSFYSGLLEAYHLRSGECLCTIQHNLHTCMYMYVEHINIVKQHSYA